MSCQPLDLGPDACPTVDEVVPQLLALLPRGRAWGTHDGGPYPGTVLWRFWSAVAAVLAFFNARACALLPEFWCATAAETRDTWEQEYGLPDGCDPYPDLCTKVAALGGTRCDYYTAVAARSGWAITCTDLNTACGAKAGNAFAGGFMAGRGLPPKMLLITVHLPSSPAHVGGAPAAPAALAAAAAEVAAPAPASFAGLAPPLAGRLEAGGVLSCIGTDAAGSATGTGAILAGCALAGQVASVPPPAPTAPGSFVAAWGLTAGRMSAGQLLSCAPAGEVSPPFAGAFLTGSKLGCVPDLSTLECLLARIVAADVHLIYETAS